MSLTSYLVSLPPARYLVLAMLLLGLLFGFIIHLGRYGGYELVRNAALDGFMLLSLPALLSSVMVKLMLRKMPFRRIAATALGGELVYGLAYSSSLVLQGVNPFLAQFALLIGAAVVFVLWYAIARFIFILKYRSVLFAVLQLLFYLIFLVSNQAMAVGGQPFFDLAVRLYISSFVLLLALVLFLFIINAPMKKNLGVSSTDAVAYFFSQWLYHNRDMEKALEQVGETVKSVVSVMGFRRKNDTVFFVTPYVHFGPFGNLGGSEFSHLLAQEMDAKYKSKTFVFHGTVTHDLNPVSSLELTKILDTVDVCVKSAKYAPATVSLSEGSMEECRSQALVINSCAMVSLSRAPEVTEDINFGLGLALIGEAEKKVESAVVVDQHNAETGDITSFEPGSLVGYRYLNAVAASLSKKSQKKPLGIGVSFRQVNSPVVGLAGVKVALFSTSPEYLIVLIDSNGITPKFRDRIEEEVKALGRSMKREFKVGIFTTDTHQTNIVRGVVNPLKDEQDMLDAIKDGVREAVADLQDAEFFMDKRWFDINVLGAKQSIEIISTVNSIVAISKITLPLILLGGILLVFAIVSKL